jgi:hypothetical protein
VLSTFLCFICCTGSLFFFFFFNTQEKVPAKESVKDYDSCDSLLLFGQPSPPPPPPSPSSPNTADYGAGAGGASSGNGDGSSGGGGSGGVGADTTEEGSSGSKPKRDVKRVVVLKRRSAWRFVRLNAELIEHAAAACQNATEAFWGESRIKKEDKDDGGSGAEGGGIGSLFDGASPPNSGHGQQQQDSFAWAHVTTTRTARGKETATRFVVQPKSSSNDNSSNSSMLGGHKGKDEAAEVAAENRPDRRLQKEEAEEEEVDLPLTPSVAALFGGTVSGDLTAASPLPCSPPTPKSPKPLMFLLREFTPFGAISETASCCEVFEFIGQ